MESAEFKNSLKKAISQIIEESPKLSSFDSYECLTRNDFERERFWESFNFFRFQSFLESSELIERELRKSYSNFNRIVDQNFIYDFCHYLFKSVMRFESLQEVLNYSIAEFDHYRQMKKVQNGEKRSSNRFVVLNVDNDLDTLLFWDTIRIERLKQLLIYSSEIVNKFTRYCDNFHFYTCTGSWRNFKQSLYDNIFLFYEEEKVVEYTFKSFFPFTWDWEADARLAEENYREMKKDGAEMLYHDSMGTYYIENDYY